MRRFWIDIKKEGDGVKIDVGKGSEVSGFMSRSWNSNPYNSWPPTHVAFAAWNSKMEYKFCLKQTGNRASNLFAIFHRYFFIDCPSGWTKSEGTCYKHFTETRTWQGAEDHCNTFGVR